MRHLQREEDVTCNGPLFFLSWTDEQQTGQVLRQVQQVQELLLAVRQVDDQR